MMALVLPTLDLCTHGSYRCYHNTFMSSIWDRVLNSSIFLSFVIALIIVFGFLHGFMWQNYLMNGIWLHADRRLHLSLPTYLISHLLPPIHSLLSQMLILYHSISVWLVAFFIWPSPLVPIFSIMRCGLVSLMPIQLNRIFSLLNMSFGICRVHKPWPFVLDLLLLVFPLL